MPFAGFAIQRTCDAAKDLHRRQEPVRRSGRRNEQCQSKCSVPCKGRYAVIGCSQRRYITTTRPITSGEELKLAERAQRRAGA